MQTHGFAAFTIQHQRSRIAAVRIARAKYLIEKSDFADPVIVENETKVYVPDFAYRLARSAAHFDDFHASHGFSGAARNEQTFDLRIKFTQTIRQGQGHRAINSVKEIVAHFELHEVFQPGD